MMPSVNHAVQIFPDFAANAVRVTCGIYKSRIFLLSFSCFPAALRKNQSHPGLITTRLAMGLKGPRGLHGCHTLYSREWLLTVLASRADRAHAQALGPLRGCVRQDPS